MKKLQIIILFMGFYYHCISQYDVIDYTYSTGGDIVLIEYFVDDDPGYGNGTSLSFTPNPNNKDVIFNGTIDVSSYSDGVHYLHVRAKDAAGKWSLMQNSFFYKQSPTIVGEYSTPGQDIVLLEYFVDQDPGYENGTSLTFTPNPDHRDVIFTGDIDVNAYSDGLHYLHVRAKDAAGKWSLMQNSFFYKQSPTILGDYSTPGADILTAEYFIDLDPGIGQASSFNFNPAQDVCILDSICINGYSVGEHYLHLRVKDQDNKWSLIQLDTFIVSSCEVYVNDIITSCDDNGTPDVYSDDNFSFSFVGTSNGGTPSYIISGDAAGTGIFDCNNPTTFNNGGAGYLTNDGDLNIQVRDSGDGACSKDIVIPVPLPGPMSCQNIAINLDATGNFTLKPSQINLSNTCGVDTIIIDEPLLDCSDLGTKTVNLTMTDVKGSQFNCSALLTINDITQPTMICKDITVNLDASGNASITTADVDNGSTDECIALNLTLSQTSFDCTDLGSVNVILTGTDSSNNQADCMAMVTIEDPNYACCRSFLNINSNPITDNTYKVYNYINSSGTVPSNGVVSFQAEVAIELAINFEVLLGAEFEAIIKDCID